MAVTPNPFLTNRAIVCLLTRGPGGGGGHLGVFWVGMCHPELQIGTPYVLKKISLKLIPRSGNGPIFYTPF